MKPKVSILIPTKNGQEYLQDVLVGIFNQESKYLFEVVVVDSGSTDETLDIIKKFKVRLYQINPEDFGYGKTRNYLSSLAKGEYLVNLSQDCIPIGKFWLNNLIKGFEDKSVAGVFGRQVVDEEKIDFFFLNSLYREIGRVITLKNIKNFPVIFSNANSAIKKTVQKQIKFNEDIIMSEDLDWAKKTINAGLKIIYSPVSEVYHDQGFSLTQVFKRNFDSGSSYTLEIRNPTFKFFSYFVKQIVFLVKMKKLTKIPYTILYEFARGSGLLVGKIERFIPTFLKNKFSYYSDLRKFSQKV